MQKKEYMYVMAMGYYGERNGVACTESNIENVIDTVLTGFSKEYRVQPFERVTVKLPESENVVIYDKYREIRERENKEESCKTSGYVMEAYINIPEAGTEIYSPCVICRLNDKNEPTGLERDDFFKFEKYLRPLPERN